MAKELAPRGPASDSNPGRPTNESAALLDRRRSQDDPPTLV